jgi:nucleotide-binding universal stress UspA family protein
VNHILCPIDFSERCAGAIRYAEALGKVFSCPITLLHVLPPLHYDLSSMEVGAAALEELFQHQTSDARKQLGEFLAPELSGLPVARRLEEGDPASTIVAVAREIGADLIVMATHGHGPFRRFILGSVTAKVLHDADCPVWTGVHLEAHSVDEVHFRRVAAAIDLGPQSERVLLWASRFASATGAELRALHATPNLEGKAREYFDPDWRTHVVSAARDEVARLQERVGTTAQLTVDSGDATPTVCRLAGELAADVLVIGRGSSSGPFGGIRANAYSIIRQSACPVASV